MSPAQQYDIQFEAPNSCSNMKNKSNKSVYFHDVDQPYDDSDDKNEGEDIFYDIDSSVAVVETNAHARNFPCPIRGTHLSGDKWKCLPAAAQAIWISLSLEVKAIILEPNKPFFTTSLKPG